MSLRNGGHVRWAFDLASWRPCLTDLLLATSCIQPEEKARLAKFVFRDDFNASLIGRLMMRRFVHLATGLQYDQIQFDRDLKGKPFLKNEGYVIDFNVSHQGRYSVLAGLVTARDELTDRRAPKIGVDVMKIEYSGGKPLGEFFRLMNRNFSDDEWRYIKGQPTEAEQLEAFMRNWCLKESYVKGQVIEMKEYLARFTTDVIGNCAFGLECNSLVNPEAEFRRMGRKALTPSPMGFLRRILSVTFRDAAKALGVRISDPDVAEFFMNVVKSTIEYRERNKIQRNDFMDLLIKLKNTESVDGNPSQLEALTFNEIAAQAFVFFIAGFETSSTAMTFCLYELAKNQELQDKARRNINEVLTKHGSMTYEAVHEMRYIENCINESLRKYPPLPNILRNVTKPYQVPGMNVTLEKDCRVLLPVYAIHHDPQLYPDPQKYDPDRFNPDQCAARHPMAFVPFGEGPRICIGQRFGMMQARVGLTYLLKNFRFTLSEKTPSPLNILANSTVLASEGGLWLKLQKI